jgi:hypothetical protein
MFAEVGRATEALLMKVYQAIGPVAVGKTRQFDSSSLKLWSEIGLIRLSAGKPL